MLGNGNAGTAGGGTIAIGHNNGRFSSALNGAALINGQFTGTNFESGISDNGTIYRPVRVTSGINTAAMVGFLLLRAHHEEKAFEHLAALVDSGAASDGVGAGSAQQDAPSPYALLKEQNEDFYGWISIDGTGIQYPVMYTPEEPEYYLRRAFDGSSSQSGVPFLSADCFDGCGNKLIYGHNLQNGRMFSDLLSYADRSFWEDHPLIRLTTPEEEETYQIMAAFYSKIYPQEEEGFRYYQYTDLRDEGTFRSYVDQVTRSALYDTGIQADYGDQLLTLSTCSYHTQDGRFVVVARKRRS